MDQTSLQAWAVARSMFKGCMALPEVYKKSTSLKPHNFEANLLSFGKRRDVVFTKKNILKLHKGRVALPEFRFWIKQPFSAFEKIKILLEFGNFIKAKKANLEYLLVLLSTCLEATAVYMNFHPLCVALIGDEEGPIFFFLRNTRSPLLILRRNKNGYWHTQSEVTKEEPRVKFSFASIDVGMQSCLEEVNPLVASALGDYQIEGYLPLMDKVGYCSRVTAKELPLLI